MLAHKIHKAIVKTALVVPVMLGAYFANAGPDEVRGRALYESCISCHGKDAQGNRELKAPNLTGLDVAYVSRQLSGFKSGIRGSHPHDTQGAVMANSVESLEAYQDIADVTLYLTSLPHIPGTATGGNIKSGEALYSTCVGCHGVNGEGYPAMGGPKLAGLDVSYVVRQLENFRTGVRGSHPSDTWGNIMALMSRTVSKEQSVTDLLTYLNSLNTKQ